MKPYEVLGKMLLKYKMNKISSHFIWVTTYVCLKYKIKHIPSKINSRIPVKLSSISI